MSEATDMFSESAKKEVVDLSEVTTLAHKQLELEGAVDRIESTLKEKKLELRKIQENDLPSAMKAAGMKTFSLENGLTVSYTEDLKISVPKARKKAVIQLMRDWGYDGNVSNQLVMDLGKGNDNAAKSLMESAVEMGVEATLTEDIPSGTVKKALNARRKEGKQDDLPFFGAFMFTKTTVK